MNAPTLDRDTGLAAMLAAALPGDHGVVADWIEEYLHLDDLAAVLRAGLDDPRTPAERDHTVCQEFRYRRLDPLVLLSMATYHAGGRSGVVVCLCTPPETPGGTRQWGRWLPDTLDEPALGRLRAGLDGDMPRWGE